MNWTAPKLAPDYLAEKPSHVRVSNVYKHYVPTERKDSVKREEVCEWMKRWSR